MRIQFCGANRTVTGSCHFLEVNGLKLLLDLGMYQGPRDDARRINQYLPAGAQDADAILLSHGHLDHCGKLPVAVRAGFAGPVYCTPATAEVARIVLLDAAEIQEENVEYLNRRERRPDQQPVEPLYRVGDAQAVLKLFKRVGYGQRTELGNDVAFTFYDAGHILGSAYIVLEWKHGSRARSLLFTADIGRYGTPIIRDPQPPSSPVDLIITESTYGAATHPPMQEVGPQLLDALRTCVDRGGRLILPAFAVGRTQTILWYVQRFIQDGSIPPLPIFVDSPMGVEVSHVHAAFDDHYDEETIRAIGDGELFGASRVNFARTSQDSRRINDQRGACVIIASSATCEFGRVLHHLKRSVERPEDMVVFTSWVPEGTLARRLQERHPRIRLLDRWYEVRVEVRTIHGLSAHADGGELLRFLKPVLRPESRAFVVHGEPAPAEAMAGRLCAAGLGLATVPATETSYYEP